MTKDTFSAKIKYSIDDLLSMKHDLQIDASSLTDDFWVFKTSYSGDARNTDNVRPFSDSSNKFYGNNEESRAPKGSLKKSKFNFYDQIYNPNLKSNYQVNKFIDYSQFTYHPQVVNENYGDCSFYNGPSASTVSDIPDYCCNGDANQPKSEFNLNSSSSRSIKSFSNSSALFSECDTGKGTNDSSIRSCNPEKNTTKRRASLQPSSPLTSQINQQQNSGSSIEDKKGIKRFQFNKQASSFKPSFGYPMPVKVVCGSVVPPNAHIIKIMPGMPIPQGAIPLTADAYKNLGNQYMGESKVSSAKKINDTQGTQTSGKTISKISPNFVSAPIHPHEIYPEFMNPYLNPIPLIYSSSGTSLPSYTNDSVNKARKNHFPSSSVKKKPNHDSIKENVQPGAGMNSSSFYSNTPAKYTYQNDYSRSDSAISERTFDLDVSQRLYERDETNGDGEYNEDSSTITSNIQILTSDQMFMKSCVGISK